MELQSANAALYIGSVIRNSPIKDPPLRRPGQWLDEQIDQLINDKIALYFIGPVIVWALAGVEWFLQLRHVPRSPVTFAFFAFLLSGYSAVRIWSLKERLADLNLGRDGEVWVGQYLDQLRETGTYAFHDVPAGRFNLDHVLISPRGIFVLETKTWSKPDPKDKINAVHGCLHINNRPVGSEAVDQAVAEAAWLADSLKASTGRAFAVRPVVLFPGWYVTQDFETKARAWVLSPKQLPSFLEREPERLVASDVHLAASHLERYIRSHEGHVWSRAS